MKTIVAATSHPYVPVPNLRSRFCPDELRERLLRSDIVAVDLDECVNPGFSQTELGYLIFFAIATKPLASSDRRFLPQMLAGGAYIRKVSFLSRIGRIPSNQELMQRYEKSMRGIPEAYFFTQARRIPTRSFSGALETLRLLGRRVPLGFISLGIDIIAEEYVRQLNCDGKPHVRFADSNRIIFATDDNGRRVFERYHAPLLVGPEDKLRILKLRMAQLDASYPLVIGNSNDEIAMATLARNSGGLSIGILPARCDASEFDLMVTTPSWLPLLTLLEKMLPMTKKTGGKAL
ncbi:MAG: hypothetical protein JXA30_04210 [Deltaproteobacteria bacterium]|nr:hypothetical protein [Deltaproteobacteria bacterium]